MGRSGEPVRVRVLGPVRVQDADGTDRTPDGPLQRRLLALLVLRRGHVVSADAAIDALWPAEAPRDPTAALHNHVSRLRRCLPDGAVGSVGTGYRLDPGLVDVDADHLTDLLADGDMGDPQRFDGLGALLQDWVGPAYPELDELDDGRAEAHRLEELRVRAQEARAEARLARGDADGLVAELTVLIDAEPLRERPRSLLMAALADTGRRAEALRVYDDFRRLLGDELGIEPSPALAAQHADLLDGAPAPAPSAPEPAKPAAPASRLPVPTTSLVGRDALTAQVVGLAATHRLVTLVGPGGVGKTRLLLEVGRRLRAAESDRTVVLCELAATDPTTAVDAVAAALGIDARPGVPLIDRVVDVVGDAPVLLLLDNCEHVLDPAAELTERLLTRCPAVSVVATSRERLRVPGEQVSPVPTLPVGAGNAPAVQLFLDRARAVAPDFEPDEAELDCITRIVTRLDGLPLAIELAASRLHTHDVTEVAAGLDRHERLALLDGGSRTTPRHGSLAAVVSWSLALLDDDLARTFADLSVFAGSFDATGAAAVCGTDLQQATADLAQLVERSLVMRAPGRRFVQLETLRAVGAVRLADSDRAAAVAGRHALHQVEWIEDADRRFMEPGPATLAEIDAALPELRTALAWLLDHDRVELAGRLVAALFNYGFMRLRPDVLGWAEQVAAADPDGASPYAPQVLVNTAYAAWMAGDLAATEAHSLRALSLAERSGGEPPNEVCSAMGSIDLFAGRLDGAAAWYRRGAETVGVNRGRRLVAAASELLALGYAEDPTADGLADELLAEVGDEVSVYAAYVWHCAGEADLGVDPGRARARFTRALELAELTHASCVTGLAGASRASVEARIGDPRVAAEEYRRLIDHWRRAGMWSTQWTMLRSIAGLLERLGRPRDAAVLVGAVRTTGEGHRIFGADEGALQELESRLRETLGEDAYRAALEEGSVLDGDAAAEHALRSL